jgi:hypothetical protein
MYEIPLEFTAVELYAIENTIKFLFLQIPFLTYMLYVLCSSETSVSLRTRQLCNPQNGIIFSFSLFPNS